MLTAESHGKHEMADVLFKGGMWAGNWRESMQRLSKSRFLKGRQCPRRLWYATHGVPEPEIESADVWEERETEGAEFERMVETLFPQAVRIVDARDQEIEREGRVDVEQSIERTRQALGGNSPILQAHLGPDRLLAIADILVPVEGGWFLWEIKASTKLKPQFVWDLAFQCEVARRDGVPVAGAGLLLLNKSYRRGTVLDVESLICRRPCSKEVAELATDVKNEIEVQLGIMSDMDVPGAIPGSRCKSASEAKGGDRPSSCGHLANGGHCAATLPKNWAGRLPGLQSAKADFVASMPEPAIENLDADDKERQWTKAQRRVIQAVQSDAPVVDKEALRAKLGELSWPVAYVDFEFDAGMAVPRFENSRPYERIPFQWSMHIQRSPGASLETPSPFLHIGASDPRRSFIDSFLDALPTDGSIVAHSQGAEMTVLNHLSESLGEPYKASINRLSVRFFDTVQLLSSGYCHPAQQGSYSIKKVAPALLGHGYDGLGIQDGMAAVVAWRRASSPECSADEREAVRRDLLSYCGRDTQLMHEIVVAVRRLIG